MTAVTLTLVSAVKGSTGANRPGWRARAPGHIGVTRSLYVAPQDQFLLWNGMTILP